MNANFDDLSINSFSALAAIWPMPKAVEGFDARGAWLICALSRDLQIRIMHAAGIVGNIGYESEGLSDLQEDHPLAGRGGEGWPMWTGPRRVSYEAWCRNYKLSPFSDEANYGYMLRELKTSYRYCIIRLEKTGSVSDAVFSFGQTYERPAGTTERHLPGFQDRYAYAQRAIKGLQRKMSEDKLYTSDIDGIWGPFSEQAYASWITRFKGASDVGNSLRS